MSKTSPKPKRLYRNTDIQVLGGVCAGLADYFDIDPVLMRLIVIVLSICSVGTGVLAYLVAWLIVPPKPIK